LCPSVWQENNLSSSLVLFFKLHIVRLVTSYTPFYTIRTHSGQLDKLHLRYLLHEWTVLGSDAARRFLQDVELLTTNYLNKERRLDPDKLVTTISVETSIESILFEHTHGSEENHSNLREVDVPRQWESRHRMTRS
jgi:hypothetical protein